MTYWEFTSVNNWFSTKLPENWSEYEDDEGTCAFFNAEKWSGNLRITPLRLSDVKIDQTPSNIIPEDNAIVIKLGDWRANFYSEQSSDECMIYYWTMGSTNFWFMCSFTIDKEFFNTDKNIKELSVVEEILSSIKILE